MPDSHAVLHCFDARLSLQDRERVIESLDPIGGSAKPVLRNGATTIDVTVLDQVMTDFRRRLDDDSGWADNRAGSDRWLAPRIHYALRLTRTEASDPGTWLWVALRFNEYVQWRWGSGLKGITEDRWWGPVHKQAFTRLWWGAEMFRNGSDYSTVERAFVRQDLPNSYLHRPVVRCRSLALAVLDRVAPAGRETEVSSDQVNDLARVLNLATAGAPPELETGHQSDDIAAFAAWISEAPSVPAGWDRLPVGPGARDTTSQSLSGGRQIVERAWAYAQS